MENNYLFLQRVRLAVMLLLVASFLSSCVEGFKDEQNFSAGVTGVTLSSPESSNVTFQPSPDGEKLTIKWPVILGSGGYEFSLYIVDNPDSPVVVGIENEVIDGCKVTRELKEDTKYKVSIRTLGNKKYNNKEAVVATNVDYSTLITATLIPNNTDLFEYFTANPIPVSATELAYELVPGGTYTMSNNVNIGLTSVTLRGDKVNRPSVTLSNAASFIGDGAGLKLKFIKFDCAATTAASLITFNSTLNPDVIDSEWVLVSSPIVLQGCDVKGLTGNLIYDAGKKYALQTILVNDCVIEQNSTNKHCFYINGGNFKDMKLTNTTFYNKQVSSQFFIQSHGGGRINKVPSWNWTVAGITIQNCTFWQVSKTKDIANYSNLAQKGNYLTIERCIFVDSGNQAIIRRFGGGNTNMAPLVLGYNSYWYNGVFVATELSTTPKDASGTHFEADPKLKDPSNGDFTVEGEAQKAARVGDPRWLPIL